jgi:alkaline phosphatase D
MNKQSRFPIGGPIIKRRKFLAQSAAVLASTGIGLGACTTAPSGRFRDDPFALGVASGDPWPDGFVLWTRLMPHPAAENHAGSLPKKAVPVRWQVSLDRNMSRIVAHGVAEAHAEDAHSIHVEVSGLRSAHTYYYRFFAGGAASDIGRTRTAPAPDADITRLRFDEAGLYTAYGHMAEEDLDFVLHLGDYIYEGPDSGHRRPWNIRSHPDYTCKTLDQYRRRYALYKAEPELRAAHAAFPFMTIFDDHEIANNWTGDRIPNGASGQQFLARRQAAFKAYWEHLPLRQASKPKGPWMHLYRRVNFGRLLNVNLCDTRQYRTPRPCVTNNAPLCDGAKGPGAHMLGHHQESWLMDGVAQSGARWNVIAQQVLMAQLDRDRDTDATRYAMDKWDGYRVPRERLLRFLGRHGNRNPVVLSADIHRHMALDLKTDFDRPNSQTVTTELVTSSISSRGDRRDMTARYRDWMDQNQHLRFISDLRGYTRATVTRESLQADFRVVDTVSAPGGKIGTRASAVVVAGRAGVNIS